MKRNILFSIFASLLCCGCANGPGAAVALSNFPPERWQVEFGPENWKVGWHGQNRVERITEWVPSEESVEDWKEIVTDAFIVARFPTASAFMRSNLADISHAVDGFQSDIDYDIDSEVLYEWWHPSSGKWPAEDQLTLAKYYPTGMMILSYARKGPRMDDGLRAKWIERLKNAKLR